MTNAKLRIALILIAIFALVAIGVSNCGGGGNSGITPNVPNVPGGDDNPSGDDLVPSDNLKDIDSMPLNLDGIDGDVYTYSYTGTPPDIDPGDILASTNEGGYLREVLSVVDTGSQLIITTTQATIDDAIDSGTIATELDFKTRVGAVAGSGNALYVPLTGLVIHDGSGLKVEILDGEFLFTPQVQISMQYEKTSGMANFLCKATGDVNTDFDMKVTGTGDFDLNGESLVYSSEPFYFAMGPIGGTAYFDFYAGFDFSGNVNGSIISGIDSTVTTSIGVQYANKNWTAINDIQSAFDPGVIQGTAHGQDNLTGYVRPVIRVQFVRIAGPQLTVFSGFQTEGEGTASPACWQYDQYGAFRVDASVDTSILGMGIGNYNGNLLNVREHVVNGHHGNCPNGGDCALQVSAISGSTQMTGGSSQAFTVTASGDTGITYAWTCNTANGYFENASSATATFHAADVNSVTSFDIQVVVDSNNCDPVTKTKQITVSKFVCSYTVGDIEGPGVMLGGSTRGYSVSMQNYSTQAVRFSWSVDPVSAGYFLRSDARIVEFFANSVSSDTEILLEVDVESDDCGVVSKEKQVTVSDEVSQ